MNSCTLVLKNKHIVALIGYFDDELFTRQVLRILLTLQHNMVGLNRKSATEINDFLHKLIAILTDGCAEWLKTLER